MTPTAATDKTRDLLGRLETEVDSLTSTATWQRFLDMQARLHKYSFNNVLLISAQRPEATYVAGFKRWQTLNRFVRKGEKGIAILCPWTGVRQVEAEAEAGASAEETAARSHFTYFRVGYVFDIAQTDGEACTVAWGVMHGDAEAATAIGGRLTEMAAGLGFQVERRDGLGSARGYCDHKTRRIVLRSDLDALGAAETLAHELAHAVLHEGLTPAEYHDSRGRYEVEAEAVAYVVMTGLGFDMTDAALPYIAGWARTNPKLVREVCGRIQATTSQLLAGAEGEPQMQAAA